MTEVAVVPDDLTDAALALRRVGAALGDLGEVAAAASRASDAAAPAEHGAERARTVLLAAAACARLAAGIGALAERTNLFAGLVAAGALGYRNGEALVTALVRDPGAAIAGSLGDAAERVVGFARSLAGGVLTLPGWALTTRNVPPQELVLALRAFATDPDVVLGSGAAGGQIGASGFTSGPGDAARLVAALAVPLGVARSGASVEVTATGTRAAGAPTTVLELGARIPEAVDGEPQVRIERYDDPGGRPGWIVAIGGTVFDGDDVQAFDLGSDLDAVAGRLSAAERTAVTAMREAGIRPGDPVVITGHSLGGLVTARIIESGAFDVIGAVTFGAPSGVAATGDVPVVAIEHDGDLVPALGGLPDPLASPGRVTVSAPSGAAEVVDAHAMAGYRRSASGLEATLGAALAPIGAALDRVTRGSPVATVTTYRGDRTDRAGRTVSAGASARVR